MFALEPERTAKNQPNRWIKAYGGRGDIYIHNVIWQGDCQCVDGCIVDKSVLACPAGSAFGLGAATGSDSADPVGFMQGGEVAGH
ncbi:hypothetical protein CIK63_03475 [Brevibacterium aurantiacum]|nr:hypothetical protein CIK63_03475 [Brevibacterium aurantiacum]